MTTPFNHQQTLEPPRLPWPVRELTTDDLSRFRVATVQQRLGLAALIAVREHRAVIDRKLGVLLVHWIDALELFSDEHRRALLGSWGTWPMLVVEMLDLESDACRDRCRDCHEVVCVFVSASTDWQALATMFGL